jgi:undecaprenyl-diphosphatase
MRPARAVALGLLQGPAELFPVSSSAHAGLLIPREMPPAARKEIEVALHLGTAVALALTTRSAPRLGLLAAATAPPALAGLAFERVVEERLGTPPTIAAGLVAGAAAMVAADRVRPRRTAPGLVDGLALGAAQAAALFPGVSRSGATRAAARARGFDRRAAAELSREVALPVLVGAAVLKGYRLARRRPAAGELRTLAAGAAAAAISTYGALLAERRITADAPLAAWAAYRVALAAAVLAVWHDRRR